jgi:hypothetical protein
MLIRAGAPAWRFQEVLDPLLHLQRLYGAVGWVPSITNRRVQFLLKDLPDGPCGFFLVRGFAAHALMTTAGLGYQREKPPSHEMR